MFLSIIIAAYNAADTITDTLNSILQIPEEKVEIVMVNDGSTDATESILQIFNEKYPNIHCINQVNKGVSAVRNIGIEASKGDYIWFIDADDRINAHNAQILLEKINKQTYDFIWFKKVNIINGKIELVHNMPQYINEGKYNINQWYQFYQGAGSKHPILTYCLKE